MYCIQCGTVATADAKFCSKCGAPLKAPESKETSGNPAISAEVSKDRKGWVHGRLLLGLLCLLALMLVLGYAGMLIMAFAGQKQPPQASGLIFWSWLFFYLLWKRRGRKGWHGGLIGAGVGVFAFTLAGFVGGYVKASTPEAQLDKNPVFRALKDLEPQTYNIVLKQFQEGIKNKQSEEQLIARTQPILRAAVLKYVPLASDDALVSYYRTQTRYAEIMSKSKPELCFDVAIARTTRAPSGLITAEHKNQELNALAELIRSSVTSVAQRSRIDPEVVLKAIAARIKEKYGNTLDNFSEPLAPGVDKSKVCGEAIMFYTELLQMQTPEAASVIRHLVANSQ